MPAKKTPEKDVETTVTVRVLVTYELRSRLPTRLDHPMTKHLQNPAKEHWASVRNALLSVPSDLSSWGTVGSFHLKLTSADIVGDIPPKEA